MTKQYIAYKGPEYIIEWYYNQKGKSPAYDYYKALSQKDKARLLYLFKRMGDIGEIKDRTKFNYEGNLIYAFKPQPDQFLCFFFEGKKTIVTNAFHKKTQQLPDTKKQRALNYKKDYELRASIRGKYYD